MTEEDGRMAAASMSIDEGRRTASASAARGAPWLLAYTVSLSIVAVLSFFLPVRATALATLFQGGKATPPWLHRTRLYAILAVAVSLGSWVIAMLANDLAHRAVLIWFVACYAGSAALLLRHRNR